MNLQNPYCPTCNYLRTNCKCKSNLNASEKQSVHKKYYPKRKHGGNQCWLFVRDGWYNYFYERYKSCSTYYEIKNKNIHNLYNGDKVLFYNKGEIIGNATVDFVKTDVKYSEIDCSIDEIEVDGFYDYGNAIFLKDIEMYPPDSTVEIRPLLHKLKFIKGKKEGEELDEFIDSGNWSTQVNTNIRKIDDDDYNLIIKHAENLHKSEIKPLDGLKDLLIRKGGEIQINNIDKKICRAFGSPKWLQNPDGSFKKTAHKIMKQKLAKVGILYDKKNDSMELMNLQEEVFLAGDGEQYLHFGYGIYENGNIVKLSDIKEDIISGKIVRDDDYNLVNI